MHGEEWRARVPETCLPAFRRQVFFFSGSEYHLRAKRRTKNKEQNDMTADIGFMQGMPLEVQT